MKTKCKKRERSKVLMATLLSIMLVFSCFTVPVMAADSSSGTSGGSTTSPTLSYTFNNSIPGDGTGVVKLTGSDYSKSYVLYWGDDSGKLANYTPIITLGGAQATEGYQMVICLAIPKGATRLLAYLKDGNSETSTNYAYAIPQAKRASTGAPLSTMFFISDIHVDWDGGSLAQNFDSALKDIKAIDKNAAGIVINGDLTNQGQTYQYDLVKTIVKNNKKDLPPIYYNIGNHDCWVNGLGNAYSAANYFAATGYNSLRREETVGNQHLLFLGEVTTAGANITLTQDDLNWLDQKLAADALAGKASYVFVHQGVNNTASSTFAGQWMFGSQNSITNVGELTAILDKYPSAIYVSGHSHLNLDARATAINGMGAAPSFINDASTAYLTLNDSDIYTAADDGAGSEGIYVEFYNDHIILNGCDFQNDSWISRSTVRVDLINSDSKLPATLSISGDSTVNQTLTANLTATGSPLDVSNLEYTWYADGAKVGSDSTYLIKSSDIGKKISVFVYDKTTGKFAGSACKYSVMSSAISNLTALYINKGPITIGSTSVSGFDKDGNAVTTANANGYIITQSAATSDNQITISGGSHHIVLQDVNMASSTNNMLISGNALVTMSLRGINAITYSKNVSSAAVQVAGGSSLTIDGSQNDTLYADHSDGASGAGIGGTYQGSCGNITINGGKIMAMGGDYAAAIGGSSTTTTMGKITINGGNVFAIGDNSDAAAGIGTGWCSENQITNGTGGVVEINGGVIYAKGANSTSYGTGAGIGAGPNDHLASITINNGSINAACGTGNASGMASDIGNSGYESGKTLTIPATPVVINGGSILSQNKNIVSPKNSTGKSLGVAIIKTGLISKPVSVKIGNRTCQATTEQDGKLYLYVQLGSQNITVSSNLTTQTFSIASNTVTFNSNGGSSVATQSVLTGNTVVKPTNPTKSGYSFGGWYTDSALTTAYDFSTAVSGNITLYARWFITPTMTLDKSIYTVGETITVSFTGAQNAKDWICVNQNDSTAGSSTVWYYLNGTTTAPTTVQADGTIAIDTSSLSAGTYYIYYCINDGYTYYASTSFTVTA